MKRISRFACAAIAALMTAATSIAAPKVLPKEVKGTVTDNNGKPISGAVVSDGYQSVVTASDGTYSFPRRFDAGYVYISIPAEYEVPLRQGTPCFYKKLSDEKSYNFVLTPLKKKETTFNLFVIADPQCQYTWHVRRMAEEGLKDMKAYSKKCKGASYAVTLGDIAYSEGWRNTTYLLPILREEFSAEKVGMPVFQTVGNHDYEYAPVKTNDWNPTASVRLDRIFEDNFGPINYTWNRGDAHIVTMNNVVFDDIDRPSKYHGDFTDDQVKWLAEDLSLVPDDKLVILCAHIPLTQSEGKYANTDKVLDLLGKRANAYILSGHTHSIMNVVHPNGVREFTAGAMSGAWWWSNLCADGTPNGYGILKIEGNQITSRKYKGQNVPDSYQMRIYRGDDTFGGPHEKFTLAHGHDALLVNIFNYAPGWKTAVYENGKYAGELEKLPVTSEMEAPYNGSKDWWAIGYNVGVVGRGHFQGSRRTSYCGKCYHMFKYVMKDPNAKIKIEVTDENGNKFTETHITTIEDYDKFAASPQYTPSMQW